MSDIFGMNDLSTQIMDLIGDNNRMISEIESLSPVAAREAAEIIAKEQRRVLDKAKFKRDKKSHVYKMVNSSTVKVFTGQARKSKVTVFESGFDTETLLKYPELIVIEFGRPGKTPRHSKRTDKRGRKKGDFPEAAQVMPIRAGFLAAKEKAFSHYCEKMLNKAKSIWNS